MSAAQGMLCRPLTVFVAVCSSWLVRKAKCLTTARYLNSDVPEPFVSFFRLFLARHLAAPSCAQQRLSHSATRPTSSTTSTARWWVCRWTPTSPTWLGSTLPARPVPPPESESEEHKSNIRCQSVKNCSFGVTLTLLVAAFSRLGLC